jgi:L-gulono-1,4-lactone dehydrogenase
MAHPYENAWKNVRFTPEEVAKPTTVKEVQEIVLNAHKRGQKIKVVGGGHSMNNIFRTEGILIDLGKMNRISPVSDPEIVELEAGTTLGDAILACANAGLHFPSLGSWYSQTIAGAIATSTHGSSLVHGSLSDIVHEVEAVLADGSIKRFSGDNNDMKAMRCHLGRLGVLTKIKLKLCPVFSLSCSITRHPSQSAVRQILGTAAAHEYVSMLWIPHIETAYIRVLTRVERRPRNQASLDLERSFMRRSTLDFRREDVGVYFASHIYQLMPKLYGKRYCGFVEKAFFDDQDVVDASYRVFLYDLYREPTENHRLRMIMNVEYAFDIAQLEAVLDELRILLETSRGNGCYLNYPRVHVRFAPKSTETLIGLNADRDTAYVGIYVLGSVRHKRQIPIAEAIEELFLKHGGRPHWGKYRYLKSRSYEKTYTGLAAFEKVRAKLDPKAMFSAKTDMFDDLDRFERAPLGAMIRSVFDADEYQPIRLL